MKTKKAKKSISDEEFVGGSIGLQLNNWVRKQAIKNLPKAQALEAERKAAGWLYVSQGKTRKLVHPKKLPDLLEQGWNVAS